MEKGYLALILHAHLPFVRHPEHEYFLEEDWLYEAVIGTYLPIIEVFDSLMRDGVDFRLTISLSPTLITMFQDDLLKTRCRRHLDRLIELSSREIERTGNQPEFNRLAVMYHERFRKAREIYCERYGTDLLSAFRKFQDAGKIEIITTCATHGFLPLLGLQRESVRSQVKMGVDTYVKAFGRAPEGIWLPECGYNPGDEEIFDEFGLKYFVVETHGIIFASPRPAFGVYGPYFCRGTGVAAFGRDPESSRAVWSAEEGYPGDYDYREFYRDIGYDLDYDYIRPYLNGDGSRKNTGIKYYRITGDTNDHQVYERERALAKAAEHAGNFMFNREKQVEFLHDVLGRKPIMVSPYDAELFGHWWFEGPEWLSFLIRKIAFDQNTIKMITPSEYLSLYDSYQVLEPSFSSWGWKGYSEVWLEGSNDWIYRHLHKMAERMVEAADAYPSADGLTRRALNQLSRELLLAQASDWPFMMKTGTFSGYARRRITEYVTRFNELYEQIITDRLEETFVTDIETRDCIFPDIDYRMYCRQKPGSKVERLSCVS